MTTIEELDKDCPGHDRDSCSDEHPVNAGVDFRYGHTWCRRCQGLWTIKADAALDHIAARLAQQGAAVPEKWIDIVRDAAFDEEGYTINPDLAEVHAEMLAAAPKPEDV